MEWSGIVMYRWCSCQSVMEKTWIYCWVIPFVNPKSCCHVNRCTPLCEHHINFHLSRSNEKLHEERYYWSLQNWTRTVYVDQKVFHTKRLAWVTMVTFTDQRQEKCKQAQMHQENESLIKGIRVCVMVKGNWLIEFEYWLLHYSINQLVTQLTCKFEFSLDKCAISWKSLLFDNQRFS